MADEQNDDIADASLGGAASSTKQFLASFQQPVLAKPRDVATSEKKKRSRPEGSKNKPKGLHRKPNGGLWRSTRYCRKRRRQQGSLRRTTLRKLQKSGAC